MAVVSTGLTSSILETVTNNVLGIVSGWMMEAIILTRKRGYSLPELAIKGIRIEIKDKI